MKNSLNRLLPFFLILAFALVIAENALAAMYQWTDKNGKVHYTDHPGNIPMDAIDKDKPVKGVFGTPDPVQYHKEDAPSRELRKEMTKQKVERDRKYRACERSCQRKDMFDTLTCVQTHCSKIR
jgi:hypothetical protein